MKPQKAFLSSWGSDALFIADYWWARARYSMYGEFKSFREDLADETS